MERITECYGLSVNGHPSGGSVPPCSGLRGHACCGCGSPMRRRWRARAANLPSWMTGFATILASPGSKPGTRRRIKIVTSCHPGRRWNSGWLLRNRGGVSHRVRGFAPLGVRVFAVSLPADPRKATLSGTHFPQELSYDGAMTVIPASWSRRQCPVFCRCQSRCAA